MIIIMILIMIYIYIYIYFSPGRLRWTLLAPPRAQPCLGPPEIPKRDSLVSILSKRDVWHAKNIAACVARSAQLPCSAPQAGFQLRSFGGWRRSNGPVTTQAL